MSECSRACQDRIDSGMVLYRGFMFERLNLLEQCIADLGECVRQIHDADELARLAGLLRKSVEDLSSLHQDIHRKKDELS